MQDKVAGGRFWRFAAAAFTLQASTVVLAVYVPQHFVANLGLELGAVGAAFAVARLVDLPIDPLLGVAMDRTRSRWGAHRVWMLAGAPLFLLATFNLFMARPGVTALEVGAWLFAFYVGHSVLTLAHVSWGARLAVDYDTRSRLFGVVGAVSVAGMALLLATPMVLEHFRLSEAEDSVRYMGWFLLLATPAALLLTLTAPAGNQGPAASPSASRWADYARVLRHPDMLRIAACAFLLTLGTTWEGSIYIFFLTDARGWTVAEASLLLMVAIAAGFLGAPFVGRLAVRFGKHKAMAISTAIYCASMLLLAVVPPQPRLLTCGPLIVCGFFYAGFFVLLRAMTADVADDIRLAEGRERGSLLFGIVNLAPKIAAALAIWMAFAVLAHVGFAPARGVDNTPAAITGLAATYLLGPPAFVAAAGLAMLGYRLGPARCAEIRDALKVQAGGGV